MKKIWMKRKKDSSAVSPVIATILMVAITVVLAAVLYVMVLGLTPTVGTSATFGTTKTVASGSVRWTVVSVSAGPALKSAVYVQIKDASGTFALTTTAMTTGTYPCTGAVAPPTWVRATVGTALNMQGFNYSSSSAASYTYISVGDTFTLDSTMYKTGSTLTLVNSDSTNQYCILTV